MYSSVEGCSGLKIQRLRPRDSGAVIAQTTRAVSYSRRMDRFPVGTQVALYDRDGRLIRRVPIDVTTGTIIGPLDPPAGSARAAPRGHA